MHYIVGLGNPGPEHIHTRHNIGFTVLEDFVVKAELPSFHVSQKYSGNVSEGVVERSPVVILLPSTFMNASGSAVLKLVPKTDVLNLIVVYDDIDLPLGEIKVSYGKGDGGHNGVKSIIEKMGTVHFTRLRIGVGQKSMWTGKLRRPKGEALASFVLGKFSSHEEKVVASVSDIVREVLTVFVTKGKDVAMNQFN